MSDLPHSIPTRATLLVRLKDCEDQKSWQEFYDTYWRMIYGLATRAGLPDSEAQDILQDTVIKVAEQMPRFQYDPKLGTFKGWLLKIARRRVIDTLLERLLPGGYLLLGHSESLLNLSTAFELVHLREDLVYRKPLITERWDNGGRK